MLFPMLTFCSPKYIYSIIGVLLLVTSFVLGIDLLLMDHYSKSKMVCTLIVYIATVVIGLFGMYSLDRATNID